MEGVCREEVYVERRHKKNLHIILIRAFGRNRPLSRSRRRREDRF